MMVIPEYIKKLVPYKSGKPIDELAREKGLTRIVKLASNENPLGPSPMALEAIKAGVNDLHRYTDPGCFQLLQKLSTAYKLPADQIFPASGSDAIIQYIVAAFSEAGDELLSSAGTFIGWGVNVAKLGRKMVNVPLMNYNYDLDGILNKITEKTRIIYIANPNNPTGMLIGKTEFDSFLNKVPENVLVVYDEAYHLYASQNANYPDGLSYLNRENVLVLRTFSKSYGLAGLRVGVAFGNAELIQMLTKTRLPFEPNQLAQLAVLAAMDDIGFLQKTLEVHNASMKMLCSKFDELGMLYTHSASNFTMLLFANEEIANQFHSMCLDNGLILRGLASFGIPNGVRINSGTIEETVFALEVISRVHKSITEKQLIQ
ncbi:MAG: aminotransferase class I/II-fold pyridoxal phosphate-dependent enzyme [Ignavibacteriales bacterium]|nr:aminotransferase class I/II-fold pyridoxal phosphate-dependent enzyme [Ignavibacteriales bacterium]